MFNKGVNYIHILGKVVDTDLIFFDYTIFYEDNSKQRFTLKLDLNHEVLVYVPANTLCYVNFFSRKNCLIDVDDLFFIPVVENELSTTHNILLKPKESVKCYII